MPFAFLIIGTLFLVSGVRGTSDKLFSTIKGDFSGSGGKPSFISWLFAILLIGSLGYIEALRPISRAFLALLIVVLFLSNGGFWSKLTTGIKSTAASATPPASTPLPPGITAANITGAMVSTNPAATNSYGIPGLSQAEIDFFIKNFHGGK